MELSIDVVIPTFRLQEKHLLPLLQLAAPVFAKIRFYLLVDNPAANIPPAILSLVDNDRVFLHINPENKGAAATRNKGIELGKGDWTLFLDDDILTKDNLLQVYAHAALSHPQEIGFIGLIILPPALSDFTKAIQATGSMDIFKIAEKKTDHAWGATANIMISRSAIGNLRFSLQYPASGGGEDIDFLLRVREQNAYKNYKSLPEASVQHPWWNDGGISFGRPFRYGKGNSWLGQLNPRYTYYDLLNTPETIFLCLLVTLAAVFIAPSWLPALGLFITGILLIEIIATAVQTFKRLPGSNAAVIAYTLAIRFVYETGVLLGNLSRFRLQGIGERFHDDGSTGKLSFFRLNTRKTIKWILYPLLVIFCLNMVGK